MVEATPEAENPAQRPIGENAVPRQAAGDAAHIAIAVANGVNFPVTWNFRHIANAEMRSRIERACTQVGYAPPVICTPSELPEGNDANDAP